MVLEETSAGAVIFRRRGNRGTLYLLLHYPSGHWDFVKGKMEGAETELETVVRETREETGITDLRFVDGFEHTIEYNFEHDCTPVHKRVVFLLAETRTHRIRLSQEHIGYDWLGFDSASRRITFENARCVLASARDHMARS